MPRWPIAAAALPLAYVFRELAGPVAGTIVLVALAALALRRHPRLDTRRRVLLAAAAVLAFAAVHLIDLVAGIVVALALPSAVLAVLAWRTLDRRVVLAALAALAALAGCGRAGDENKPLPRVSVALDFTPNAVHAPIYAAVREGLDRQEGVRLRIRTPGASPDSLKTVLSGAVDMGVLDIHDLGLAVDKGRDVVAVGALVQRPLAAIVALPPVARPRQLEGRKVGVSGLPSDPAVLDAVMRHDGGDYKKAKLVTIGFSAVQNLVQRNVAAVPVFWNAEGVALRQRGVPIREFRVDDYGAPRYPEVVLVTRRATLERRHEDVEAAVRAIADGIGAVRARPEAAVAEIARASGGDPKLVRAQLRAVAPILGTALHRDALDAWAAWDARFGVLPKRPDVRRAFALSG